ncbi:hypothetical protein SEMRO_187_G080851.1 [Seminavis robusta]|uniref:Uncharacterized protein n=1 Tax=Seminavis robusta TaxID=568900 RepID=A0A9N8DJH9_9STRA|nr:hypothetical protein SEMRO_187_G080851.1 [Seminavis robusta]|eukprot:Sro187_g080851.1  (153) ;mRNA; f:20735-21193
MICAVVFNDIDAMAKLDIAPVVQAGIITPKVSSEYTVSRSSWKSQLPSHDCYYCFLAETPIVTSCEQCMEANDLTYLQRFGIDNDRIAQKVFTGKSFAHFEEKFEVEISGPTATPTTRHPLQSPLLRTVNFAWSLVTSLVGAMNDEAYHSYL